MFPVSQRDVARQAQLEGIRISQKQNVWCVFGFMLMSIPHVMQTAAQLPDCEAMRGTDGP